jgi:hypothetical protein
MTLFKQQADGKFDVLEKTPFADLEKKLEDWIEANPGILFSGEPLAVISRQPRNVHGKYLDLLAVDRRGTTVIVELKRGEAPRDVMAQALEYAAWVESLSDEQLDQIAGSYAASKGIEAHGVRDLYARTFAEGESDPGAFDPGVVTFNSRQTIVIVAEAFTPEVEQTARYLRSRLGADLHAIRFSVHKAGGEIVLETNTVVGGEPVKAVQGAKAEEGTDDDIRAYVNGDLMKSFVGVFDDWTRSYNDSDFTIEHPGWNRRIRFRGLQLVYYYHAKNWLSVWYHTTLEADLQRAQEGLSQPEHLKAAPDYFWCRLYTAGDIELIKAMLAERVARLKLESAG